MRSLYYAVSCFLMTSILLLNNNDLKNTIKLISCVQFIFICLVSLIQFKEKCANGREITFFFLNKMQFR